jgi:long-subunit fatty acid transport protein
MRPKTRRQSKAPEVLITIAVAILYNFFYVPWMASENYNAGYAAGQSANQTQLSSMDLIDR